MAERNETRRGPTAEHVGGAALIFGAVGFIGAFAYLAARFRYPEILDGDAAEVLPALLATGTTGRAAWSFYALLPLLWIPAGVGAFQALRRNGEGMMRLAMHCATLSALSMMLGLMRWPSIHWELARGYATARPDQQPLYDALFLGLNRYLGNFIGEFLGELSVSVFFLLSAVAIVRMSSGRQRVVGYVGILTAVAGMIGMFRNVTPHVAWIAEINNYLLPLWMIVFGVRLMRRMPEPPQVGAPAAVAASIPA